MRYLSIRLCLLFAVGGCLGLAACEEKEEEQTLMQEADTPAETVVTEESIDEPDWLPSRMNTVSGRYMAARAAQHRADWKKAARFFDEVITQQPDDATLLSDAHRLFLIAGEVDKAIEAAQAFLDVATEPGDVFTARLLVAVAHIHEGRLEEAAAQIRKLPVTHTLEDDAKKLMLAWLADKKTPQKKLPNISWGRFGVLGIYHRALLEYYRGGGETAVARLEPLMKITPRLPYRMVRVAAGIIRHAGDEKEATDLLRRYGEAHEELLLTDESGGLKPEVLPEKPLISTPQDGIAELFFGLAGMLSGQRDTEDLIAYLQLAQYLAPDHEEAKLFLAGLLERGGYLEQALPLYTELSTHSVLTIRATLSYVQLLYDLGRKEEAFARLEALISHHPAHPSIHLQHGDLLRREERYADAAVAYSEAIKYTPDPGRDDWVLFYARGIAYERSDQWDKAEADFLKALELYPSQPDVQNYLGYSWLLMKKNIPQVKDMLFEAVSNRPRDAHIIDSYGWAFYRLGEYDEARIWLERALMLMPGDATLNDHLGDIYWKLGRKREARYQWERALIFDPEEKVREEISRKLEEGLQAAEKEPAQESAKEAKEAGDAIMDAVREEADPAGSAIPE